MPNTERHRQFYPGTKDLDIIDMVAGGTYPDILYGNTSQIDQFLVGTGLAFDRNELIKKDNRDMKIHSQTIERTQFDTVGNVAMMSDELQLEAAKSNPSLPLVGPHLREFGNALVDFTVPVRSAVSGYFPPVG